MYCVFVYKDTQKRKRARHDAASHLLGFGWPAVLNERGFEQQTSRAHAYPRYLPSRIAACRGTYFVLRRLYTPLVVKKILPRDPRPSYSAGSLGLLHIRAAVEPKNLSDGLRPIQSRQGRGKANLVLSCCTAVTIHFHFTCYASAVRDPNSLLRTGIKAARYNNRDEGS